MKKAILGITLTCLLSIFSFAKVAATFPDLMRPYRIMVNEGKLYILEDQNIFIYSTKDYKLLKNFGQKGEGPREFMGSLNITAYTDNIIVNSQGKISYWTKMGDFIREVKCPFSGGVETLGKNMYVSLGWKQGTAENKTRYTTIDLYDSNFVKIREIDRKESASQEKGLWFFTQSYYFINSRTKNRIYVLGHDGFLINVFNEKGEKLFEVKQDYEKLDVTAEDKKEIHHYFKNHPHWGRHYAENKHMIKFADEKPAIKNFLEYDNMIYVETFNRKGDNVEFYVFDQNGKLVNRVFLPLYKKNAEANYPYFIDEGKFYILVENEDEEVWEIRVTEVGL
jgi:hypothetical protein